MAASDKERFEQAMAKWERLHDNESFSRAPELGLTAILYTKYDQVPSEDEESCVPVENIHFAAEAEHIAEMVEAQNGNAIIIPGISLESLEEGAIANRDISNIILISHGHFSAVYDDKGNLIDWVDVAGMTTHLKTGYIEQRFCGQYRYKLAVPFGLLAVSHAYNVLAPKGKYFAPEKNPEHESLIESVTTSSRLTYRQIKTDYPHQPADKYS